MANDEEIQKKFLELEKEEIKAQEQVDAYQRKLFKPIWEKRREIVKSIGHFWTEVISTVLDDISDNDTVALDSLIDFHVEFDDKDPQYRKVIAVFRTEDNVIENETLTKEFIMKDDNIKVVSKADIKYKDGKKKDSGVFLQWFGSDAPAEDEMDIGTVLTDNVFPAAMDVYEQNGDDDDSDRSEIELGSEDEDSEEENQSQKRKRSKA